MKTLLYVCFILFAANNVTGQTVDPLCSNVIDFALCLGPGECDENSRCNCFEGQPFCRCNSRVGEFYIDEDCSQRWTVVTFALVASLPGLTLAVLVGVIVYVIMLSSSKRHKGGEVSTVSPKEQDLFPGIIFASEMNSQPAPNTRPAQQSRIPMITIPNHANSPSDAMRDPSVGGPARPYGPSNSMHPYPDRVTDGRSREPYSMSGGMRDSPMEGPARSHSSRNAAGWGQTGDNLYVRDAPSRNPYDDRSPPPNHRSDYRQPAHSHEDVNQHYSPAPHYGPPDRGNPRGGFPRPHLNLQY